MAEITTAQREYFARPADERFDSLDALVKNAQADKEASAERAYNLKDLRAIVTESALHGEQLRIASPRGIGRFTHFSFGQACRALKIPASYMRSIPAELAARCLNHGIDNSTVGEGANLLVRNGDTLMPVIRAWTSTTYGRAWDADIYGTIQKTFAHSEWKLPLNWDRKPDGAYRGDRDSLLLLVNGGSILEDKTLSQAGQDGTLFKGLLVRNSEVGNSSVFIDRILYRWVCGNMCLYSAVVDRRFRRRHVGSFVVRDVIRAISDTAVSWTAADNGRDQAIIDAITTHQLAHTKEGVIDELQKIGLSKRMATTAYEVCEEHEPASPYSTWGIVQGLTRLSQESGWQDQRVALDLQASRLANRAHLATAA